MSQTMTAIYNTRSSAEEARDDLLKLKIPPQDISLHAGGEPAGAAESGSGDRGFLQNLFELFVPQDEHPTYLEHMRRGGYLVAARVPDGLISDAEDILHRHDPLDLNDRATEGQKEAWSGGRTSAESSSRLRRYSRR